MPAEPQGAAIGAIGEMLTWLEEQVRAAREEQARALAQTDQLRRQVYDLAEQLSAQERALREVEPRFAPFKGVPEKINNINELTEQIRQQVAANKAEIDNALRLLRAEANYDRQERAEAIRRIEQAAGQIALIAADIAQVQAQASQISLNAQTLVERQREVEDRVEQFGLRLDRAIEVNRDLESRIREEVLRRVDERDAVVFERLQVVGEMVRRNEQLIEAATREQTLRAEVLDEVAVIRDLSSRTESRTNSLEESVDRLHTDLDRLRGEIALLEGRHSGLGERVAGIRRDIAEVIDHVRAEFAKYNEMTEKQRRKQIQVLEQELREMKFHAFRPPEDQ
jgi:chromosome segregation ATPase